MLSNSLDKKMPINCAIRAADAGSQRANSRIV